MRLTLGRLVVLAGVLAGATPARAQTIGPEGTYFFRIALGGQLQEGSFGNASSFSHFLETGTIDTQQNIERGAALDISAGYQFSSHLGLAIGLWGAQSTGNASSTVK